MWKKGIYAMKDPFLYTFLNEHLLEATFDELQEKMNAGALTSKQLVMMYLIRIATIDSDGPKLNSVLEVNPDAIQIAAALDAERKLKGPRGPLHGIPILLKDNIDTHDKMHTSAGSLALAHSVALKDSFIARQLRNAGAVLLGKTNMTEWANFMTEGMKNGYSSRGGQVLNPYGPGTIDVGGSSAGSGASIAANLASAAVGTETSGSILNPAAQNSLVGIKPTLGLVSRSGIIPIAHSQDTAGPMARTVKDAALLLTAMMGADEQDPITLTTPLSKADITAGLEQENIKGLKLGIAKEGYFNHLTEEGAAILNEALEKLNQLGAELAEATIPSTEEEWHYDVLTYEFKTDLNAYLRGIDPSIGIHSLADVIQFNLKHPKEMLKYGQKTLLEAEQTSGGLVEKEYIKALEEDLYFSTEKGIDYALKELEADALVFPHFFGADIAAKAGYPSITVPAGYTKTGQPIGITFTGTAFSEPLLIKLAYAFEQATKHRKPPIFESIPANL
jgi:amidase